MTFKNKHQFTLVLTAILMPLLSRAGMPLNDLQGSGGLGYNPLAYTAGRYVASETNSLSEWVSLPQAGLWYVHFYDENVNWTAVSASFSIAKRLELSYGHGYISNVDGDDTIYSHNLGLKLLLLKENDFETAWVPAFSVGGKWKHTSTELLKGLGVRKQGMDAYLVATKMITQTPLPVLLSAGALLSDEIVCGALGHNDYNVSGFGSISVMPLQCLAVGVEYKQGADVGNRITNASYWNAHAAWLATDKLTFVAAYGHTGNASQGLDDIGVGQAIILSVQYGF
jgi:hypothetical protein